MIYNAARSDIFAALLGQRASSLISLLLHLSYTSLSLIFSGTDECGILSALLQQWIKDAALVRVLGVSAACELWEGLRTQCVNSDVH